MTNRKEITRQSLMNDDVRTWHERYGALMDVVTPSYFREILDHALVTAPPSGDVWVFAYGSLIWNPAIEFTETRVGQLFGYSKKFCLKSLIGRGTPDRPGLLAKIANIFSRFDLVLYNARISTLGERVEDTFYLRNANNQPIDDQDLIENLKQTIRNELDSRIKQAEQESIFQSIKLGR